MGIALGIVGSRDASASPPVVRAETACPGLAWSGRAFVDLLRVELKADGIDVELDGSVQDTPTLAATPDVCTDAAHGASVVFRRGEQTLERHVDLTDVAGNARARVLALAAAELLREAFASPPTSTPTPPPNAPVRSVELHVVLDPSPPSAIAPSSRPVSPPAAAHAFTISLAGEARALPAGPAGLFGARAGIAAPLGRTFVLSVDAAFGRGASRDVLGEVSAFVAGGSVGVAVAAGPDALRIHAGPRLEVAWAHVDAAAATLSTAAFSADSALALLTLSATAHVLIGSGLHVLVGVDAGATLKGFEARADGRTVTGFVGPLLGVRIGFAWSPGVP